MNNDTIVYKNDDGKTNTCCKTNAEMIQNKNGKKTYKYSNSIKILPSEKPDSKKRIPNFQLTEEESIITDKELNGSEKVPYNNEYSYTKVTTFSYKN